MKCCCCNSEKNHQLIDLGRQPYANKYPKLNEFKLEKINKLVIVICDNCFTAFSKKVPSRNTMFEDYYYLSSVNEELVNHFNNLAKLIPKDKSLLDIGSNDGVFLKPLIKKKVKAIGIDPSINVGKIANNQGFTTHIGFFDDKNTKILLSKYGKFDYIVASSIFTHVENPNFIKNLAKLLKSNGTFILEIEYIKNILQNIEFERFYFDRPYYYSINGIQKLFYKYGFFITKVENITPHGGSLRFFIQKNQSLNFSVVERLIKKEKIFFESLFIKNFNAIALRYTQKFKNFLVKQSQNNKKVIGYGCPARFSTITNFAKINKDLLPYVVDDSPLKQDRYSPGKHIPIVPKDFLVDFRPDVIIVFAYEYFNTIYKFTKKLNLPHFKPIPLLRLDK